MEDIDDVGDDNVEPIREDSDDYYINAFLNYLEHRCQSKLEQLLTEPDPTLHYGVCINLIDLLDYNNELATNLLVQPRRMLPLFDESLRRVQAKILDTNGEMADQLVEKPLTHIRIEPLPLIPEFAKTTLPKCADVGILISLRGTVIRTGELKMLEWEREMECARCKYRFRVQADIEQRNQFPIITKCPNQDIDHVCNSKTFNIVEGSQQCRDYQEIKVQEQIQQLGIGAIPRSMVVVLEDDLVDSCKAGDDVTIVGIVIRRWKPLLEGERCDLELILLANYVAVHNEQNAGLVVTEDLRKQFEQYWREAAEAGAALRARDLILQSICPGVFGLYLVKLAVALVMIGGVAQSDRSGMKIRGEPHLLLVGDPGTGKSQFLKYASKLGSRCVLTTGIGTTNAGLTVTAVKDHGGEWMLEAGALVLADGGVCCIDEFSSIRKADMATIHEAMEQQTLSVAKAGLVCKLRTRTSIIACTNPKGRYDLDESIATNTALASPLLSRFDLILVLLDRQDAEWDKEVANFILCEQQKGSFGTGLWSLERLQAYIKHVKTTFCNVTMSEEAEEVLQLYYTRQRRADVRDAGRTTIRLLESLIRLAQAHARLMFRERVELEDAVIAVMLMESSNHSAALGGVVVNPLHSYFPPDPDAEYARQERKILYSLGAEHLLRYSKYNRDSADAGGGPLESSLPPPASAAKETPPSTASASSRQSTRPPLVTATTMATAAAKKTTPSAPAITKKQHATSFTIDKNALSTTDESGSEPPMRRNTVPSSATAARTPLHTPANTSALSTPSTAMSDSLNDYSQHSAYSQMFRNNQHNQHMRDAIQMAINNLRTPPASQTTSAHRQQPQQQSHAPVARVVLPEATANVNQQPALLDITGGNDDDENDVMALLNESMLPHDAPGDQQVAKSFRVSGKTPTPSDSQHTVPTPPGNITRLPPIAESSIHAPSVPPAADAEPSSSNPANKLLALRNTKKRKHKFLE